MWDGHRVPPRPPLCFLLFLIFYYYLFNCVYLYRQGRGSGDGGVHCVRPTRPSYFQKPVLCPSYSFVRPTFTTRRMS